MFKQLGIEPQNFKGVDYLILPGKSGEDAFKAAREVYNNIVSKATGELENMIKDGNFVIKYLDADNKIKNIIYKNN